MLILLLTQTPLVLVQGHGKTLFSCNKVQSLVSLVKRKPNSFPSPPPWYIFVYTTRAFFIFPICCCKPVYCLCFPTIDSTMRSGSKRSLPATASSSGLRCLCLHNAAPSQGKPSNRYFLDTNLTTHAVTPQHPNAWQAPKKEP